MEAETAYKKAIIADPNTLDWYKGLARTLISQGKHLEIISLFEEIITNFDAFSNVGDDTRDYYLLLQANSYVALEMQMAAASNYELVKRMGKATANSMGSLGDIYVNENQIELATLAYIDSIDLDVAEAKAEGRAFGHEYAVTYSNVMAGRGYWANTDRIIAKLRSVYSTVLPEKDHLHLLRLEAQSAIALQKDSETTISLLEEILRLDSKDGNSLLLLAEFQHSESGRHIVAGLEEEASLSLEKSREYFEQAIELDDDPEFQEKALIKYGQMLVRERLYCEAIPHIEQALELNYTGYIEDYLERVDGACRNQRIGSR